MKSKAQFMKNFDQLSLADTAETPMVPCSVFSASDPFLSRFMLLFVSLRV